VRSRLSFVLVWELVEGACGEEEGRRKKSGGGEGRGWAEVVGVVVVCLLSACVLWEEEEAFLRIAGKAPPHCHLVRSTRILLPPLLAERRRRPAVFRKAGVGGGTLGGGRRGVRRRDGRSDHPCSCFRRVHMHADKVGCCVGFWMGRGGGASDVVVR
jgi:hypothetical protein